MYGGLRRLHFVKCLWIICSHSSCSNYDEQCPQFRATPQELSGDSEEHEYGPLNPHAMAHVASWSKSYGACGMIMQIAQWEKQVQDSGEGELWLFFGEVKGSKDRGLAWSGY